MAELLAKLPDSLDSAIGEDAVWVMAGGIIAQQGLYANLAACDGPLADSIAPRAQEL